MVFKSTDNWFNFPAGCYCGVAVKGVARFYEEMYGNK